MPEPSEQDDAKGCGGSEDVVPAGPATASSSSSPSPPRTVDVAGEDALESSRLRILDLSVISPHSNEEASVKDSVPSHANGGGALEMGRDERLSSRWSMTSEDLSSERLGAADGRANGELEPVPEPRPEPGPSTPDNEDEGGADDEPGPPPMDLERQPSASAPKKAGRRAPDRTASSASSQDSSTEPSAFVLYRSVKEIFQKPPVGDRQQGSSSPSLIVPVGQLRKLATAGSLDSSHRGVSWRILLGYLNPDRSLWSSDLLEKRELYRDLCRQVLARPVDDGAQLKQQPRRQVSPRTSPRGGGVAHGADDSSRSASSDPGADDDVAVSVGGGEGALGNGSTNSGDAPPSPLLSAAALSPPPVPQAVREAWKRSGRDWHVLESVCSGINALRLPESCDETDPPSSTDEEYRRRCDDFVKTAALLDEIRKDVVRTCSDLSFYLDPALGMRRYAVLERILLISATYSNRAVRYVQGMNEIVAILYFVLTSLDEDEDDEDEEATSEGDVETCSDGRMEFDGGSNTFSDIALDNQGEVNDTTGVHCDGEVTDWADHAEPDTYWLFHALLSEMTDVFVPDMDNAETGIQGRIAAMQELLKRHDMETAEHLEEIGIDTGFYAVRWWTTLLSREFRLPDTVRLWDSMFASTHKDNFIRYVCVTMVLVIRDLLLKADFSTCLRMLQSYPPTNMEQLLQSSRALWVYESQITVACHRGGISLHQALQTIAPPPGVVFAFGLRNGMLQARDNDVGSKTAELKVREATQAVASQAQVIFGRARGLYSRSMLEYRKYRSTSTASSANSDAKLGNDASSNRAQMARSESQDDLDSRSTSPPDDPDDTIYMEAILKA